MSLALSDLNAFPPGMDETMLGRMLSDLGRKMFSTEEIAQRYGVDIEQIRALLRRPAIFNRLKREKALWESDENIKDRARLMALLNITESMPLMGAELCNPKVPLSQRTELLKVMARMGEIDGSDRQQAQGGVTMAPVSIQFNFTGAGRRETFTTVVDATPVEASTDD